MHHPIHQYRDKGLTPALRGRPLWSGPLTQTYHYPRFLAPEQVDAVLRNLPPHFHRTVVADGVVSEAALPVDDWPWLYDLLWDGLRRVGRNLFGLTVKGMYEEPVVLRYGIKDQNGWHSDYDIEDRSKVSVSVVLNDHSEYEGGDLEVLRTEVPPLTHAGDAVFFAGYLAHRVTPVTSGRRTVLVAWAGGPALT